MKTQNIIFNTIVNLLVAAILCFFSIIPITVLSICIAAISSLIMAFIENKIYLMFIDSSDVSSNSTTSNNNSQEVEVLNNDVNIHHAVAVGNIEKVLYLIKEGVDINAKSLDGLSPLHISLKNNYKDIALLLIESGADLNLQDNCGFSPIFLAIYKGYNDILEKLLENGANIDLPERNGRSPIHIAALYAGTNTLIYLIENGANINQKDINGETPLHKAALYNRLEIVLALIQKGANFNITNKYGDIPLYDAIKGKSLKIVRALIKNGADINTMNKNGITPLHKAVEKKQLGISLALIENNANINQKDIDGLTPLHYAVHEQQYEIVVTLLNNGADINAEDKEKESPLDFATQMADQDMINILNTPIKDLERQYLHILIKNNMLVMALELIQKIKLEEQDIIAIKDINNRTSNLIKEQYDIANKTSPIEENKQSLAKAICGHDHKSPEADTQFKLGMFSLKNKIDNCHLTAYKVFNYLGKFTNESKIKLNILSYAGMAPINIQEFTPTIPTKADEVNKSDIQMLFRNKSNRSFYNVNPGFYKP